MGENHIEEQLLPGYSILDNEALLLLEKNTDYILENIGIDLHDDPISLETLKTLGATVDGIRVRVSGQTLREYIKTHAPSDFFWRGQSASKDVIIGGGKQVFAPVYGPPEVHRSKDGKYAKQLGTLSDYREMVSICDAADALQTTGFMLCYVHDLPEEDRHLAMAKAHLELSDKPFMGTVISEDALHDVINLVGRETSKGECNLLHLINSSPPLRYQQNALKCLRAASLAGEGSVVVSYSMMGATSPATLAGTIAQNYAEVLLGLALAQLYKPGVPVVFGLYGIPFSMSSMIPVFGNPVSATIQMVCGQLARGLGIPFRGDGGVTSSKIDDAQSGFESGSSTSACKTAKADFILHSAGWLQNGMCTSPDKLLRDSLAIKSVCY